MDPIQPAKTYSVALLGVEGHITEIEAHVANSAPGGTLGFALIGLPDAALNEARDRVRSAIENSGEQWPARRIVVGLSPATLPKTGSHYDLAIAICLLTLMGVISQRCLDRILFLGELALNGRLRPIRGTLSSALAASRAGFKTLVLPEPNVAEAQLVDNLEVFGIRSLRQAISLLRRDPELPFEPPYEKQAIYVPEGLILPRSDRLNDLDLADVLGQTEARRAIEVAAAGGHHIWLSGPPGAGKTMLAERLPGLLPDLAPSEALEVTAIHSVAGLVPPDEPLVTRPPYSDPHPNATATAVLGGGSGRITPGAISLAHCGVLFIDEACEWKPSVLDALRQPLETGRIAVARSVGTAIFPARFQLVLASNPCPCGMGYGKGTRCTCSPGQRARYDQRLSGPFKDRIDISLAVDPVSRADMLADGAHVESTKVVAARVAEARARQLHRFRQHSWSLNSQVPGHELRRTWRPEPGALAALEKHAASGLLTARGCDRVLRAAWTLADLAGRDRPGVDEIYSALTLRLGSRMSSPSGDHPDGKAPDTKAPALDRRFVS